MPYVARVPVRFGDVDWARIAYYPRIFHLLHVAFEDLFAEAFGIPYAQLLGERKIGFPAVHIEADFLSPLRFGEVLQVGFTVPRIGRSSIDIDHLATVAGPTDVRARVRMTRVAVDMETLRALPIPDDLRAAFERLSA